MTKDKALEELFFAQKPQFSDKADFMASLTERLDAVEFIKQHQEETIRRYKMLMVAAFVVGIVSGAVAIGYVLSMPADVPLFTFQVQTGFLHWVAEYSRLIAATGLSLLLTLGIISIISNVQDILRMNHGCWVMGDGVLSSKKGGRNDGGLTKNSYLCTRKRK